MSDDIHPDKHGEATRHRQNVKQGDDNMSDEHAYQEGEPSCMNCQSKDIEEVYSEAGQYIGKWCADCGVMNRSGGLFTQPNETVPKDDLRELIEAWREQASEGTGEIGTSTYLKTRATYYRRCADDLEDLLSE
jgi:hypothetical protein